MKKSFIITSMAAFAALCFSLTAQAQGPVVVSDKDDYAPGETALFSAAGFQPGEMLDFSVAISDENGEWIPDIAWADVPADASGGAEVDYVVPQTWADKSLQLTAMGLTSGLIATTTFTDHSPDPVLSYSGYSISALGNTVTVSVNVTFTSGSTGHTISDVKALLTNLPGPNVGAVTLTGPGDNGAGTWSKTFTGVCGTTYTFDKTNTSVSSTTNPPHNFNNVDAPSGLTAMTSACGPTNSAPVITSVSDVSVPLGQIAGCSGQGPAGGFGKSVDVAYSVEPDAMDTTLFHVYATFNGGNQTLIANVQDVDGNLDLAGITLSQDSESFTFGPGSHTQSFSTMITATDNAMPPGVAGPTAAGGQFTVQIIYNFTGFFSPLNNVVATKVKRGSAVPVKFQLFDCDGTTPIDTGTFTINVTLSAGVVADGLDIDDAGSSAGDPGNTFRYDPVAMQWIFNLKTNSTYTAGTYWIWVDLGDGVEHHVAICIKP